MVLMAITYYYPAKSLIESESLCHSTDSLWGGGGGTVTLCDEREELRVSGTIPSLPPHRHHPLPSPEWRLAGTWKGTAIGVLF